MRRCSRSSMGFAVVVVLTCNGTVSSTAPEPQSDHPREMLLSGAPDCAECGLQLIDCLTAGGAILVSGVQFLDCWDACAGEPAPPTTPTPAQPRQPVPPQQPPLWPFPFPPPPTK